ncbi:flagellar protein FlaG [Pseudomonas sp. Marseille-QA0892]
MDVVKTNGFASLSQTSSPTVGSIKNPGSLEPITSEAVQPSAKEARAEMDGVKSAVSDLNSQMQNLRRNLDFSVDDGTGDVVVKVIDGESGKVVRQIPSEEVLKLAEQLDDLRSLMFQAKA